ncbi:hypothetical protein HanRHA438_Chr01g0000121 [Helianthus annuus]|nr:hypothetical protein HanIR_Chr01g0000141 [Helianthus annuus]KAJ0808135.1 hypothetical protein HanPI659440_Chr01g0000151 [Helianthus annuus]KAJ0946085.1 hypothetical protein HanRHA438_Chr01g0000121 [Helianthus annuus]
MLKGAEQPSSSEPGMLSDDIETPVDLEFGVEGKSKKDKELSLVVGKENKAAGKKVAGLKGSGKGVEGSINVSPGEVYLPGWKVTVGDSFKSSSFCEDVLTHFAPPTVRNSCSSMDDDLMISKMMMGACNLSALLPKGISHFRKRMQVYEDFSKKRDGMKASMAALKKESEGFVEKEKAWVVKVGELTPRHEVEVNELEKQMEALNVREKASSEEKEGLKASLVQVTSDNKWLIEHGFQQLVTYLLHSSEFNKALGDVYTKLLVHGRHHGFTAGYKACEAGEPQDKSSLFHPKTFEVFKDSVLKMEHLTHPYVGEVSECFGKPPFVLQELKPHGRP